MSEEQQYQSVASKDELQEGGLLKVQVKDKELVLSMVEGKVYAMQSILLLSDYQNNYCMV